MHVPSRPLMRSLLSQFQTSTVPRRIGRFFRVWLPSELPRLANRSVYFGLATFYFRQPFQPSTCVTLTFAFILSTPAFCATPTFPTEKSTACNYLCRFRLLTSHKFLHAFAQPFAQDGGWNTDFAGQGEPRNYLDAHEILKHFVCR
jgi:hypothetical protein